MASRPVVAVTGDARRWAPSWWCIATALTLVGAKPLRLTTRRPDLSVMPDALLVSGGNDIGPELYGEPINPRVKIDPDRDKLEMQWIKTALDHGWPLLGICRGAQLINVVLGGTLYTDIRELRRRTYNRPSLLPTKQVAVEQSSFFRRVVKRNRLRVNSLHHQAVKTSGSNLRVVGRDLDDFCQAFEGTLPQRIIGVQWHPEYLFYLPSQLRLFRWLKNAARS